LDGRTRICIHGHFYQPPRENPFTGEVPVQPTAAPFENWNERITEECYRPNAAAPILGDDGEPRTHVNNYAWISFDFGPTLLTWLESNAPDVYRAVIDADKESASHFGGHGSAMAHSYNHTILPLSNSRDKRTQIKWGIADFEHRFGRRPEGMWLPETAVDLESLRFLAEEGISFTILSPYQAATVRGPDGEWLDVFGGTIDTRVPYRVEVGDGRRVVVFFYNGQLSQEIAFNGVLEDGRLLAKRLIQAIGEGPSGGLSHVATDGETYGHHHRHGEMALAAAIEEISSDPEVSLTNYSQHLAGQAPTMEARIVEGSSWSCAHGVERWRADCGCSSGRHPGYSQVWRAPLRAALDWLRDQLIPRFERAGSELFDDPWLARDGYIDVILGGSPEVFLEVHATRELSSDERQRALGLLEIQHEAMLMYTSCGWFFDDIAGLESVLVLRHAGRVVDLSRRILGIDLEPGFLAIVEGAWSNQGESGREIYSREVAPFLEAWGDEAASG
jgi:alpha-amylase/alpha-mannosidase (GH57 family)